MPHMISQVTMNELALRLGQNLRRIRRTRHLSVRKLAQAVQCHPDTLKHYERGTRTRMESLVLLVRLTKELDCSLTDLVCG